MSYITVFWVWSYFVRKPEKEGRIILIDVEEKKEKKEKKEREKKEKERERRTV